MKPILLLTKNILIDTEWQERLNQLGYEVLCSSSLLERILFEKDLAVLSIFKAIIFSESITNEEIAEIVKISTDSKVDLFRIDEQSFDEELTEGPKEQGNLKYLNSKMSMGQLREVLAETAAIKIFATVFPQRNEETEEPLSKDLIASLYSAMSKKERELFEVLYEYQGDFVSRIDLSNHLWTQGVSNSSLAQLSQIIGRLKKKMHKLGINNNLIVTHWNKGYALSKEFSEAIASYLKENSVSI